MRHEKKTVRRKKGIGNKVAKNAQETQKPDKQAMRHYFKKLYDNPKVWEFPTKNKINMKRWFAFSRDLVKLLSEHGQAVAVYPVLCYNADFEDDSWFKVNQKNLARQSGLSEVTVRDGLRDLYDMNYEANENILQAEMVSEVGEDGKTRRFYMYKIDFVRRHDIKKNVNYFPFHASIIESGAWANLPGRAKLLYIGFRSLAWIDDELYEKAYATSLPKDLPSRQFDVYYGSLSKVCREVGIQRNNLNSSLKQLMRNGLIERITKQGFIVHLRPHWIKEKGINE